MFGRAISSIAVAAILLCEPSLAAPHFTTPNTRYIDKRQAASQTDGTNSTSDNSTVVSGNTTTTYIQPNIAVTSPNVLEPVIPPAVNSTDLSLLSLSSTANTTLAWAGSTGTANKHRKRNGLKKRDGGVLSQASFAFAYPAVPLDHSSYVSNVSCPINGSILTGLLTGPAYNFAKAEWSGVSDVLFVTAADGCGPDANNDYFHATSIIFNDANSTFTATGTSNKPLNVANYMSLVWGDLGTSSLKRSIDKRDMFEPHPIHQRGLEVGGTIDFFDFSWGVWLQDIIGVDNDAPWDDAALLATLQKGYGIDDDDYEKGENAEADGHHRRSANETSLLAREEPENGEGVDFGIKLYCVECGFGGSAKLYGTLEVGLHIFPPSISFDTVQAGFKASFEAGINLGIEAYVEYYQKATLELAKIPIPDASIEIFDVILVGPYVGLSIEAEETIKASGSLLVGGSVEWPDIDILLDILDPSNSHANGFSPQFTKTANATGELSMEAKLGLPIEFGIALSLESDIVSWEADVGIVDTPAIVMEGVFEVSADLVNGSIETDINGGCYGIAWDIHFENTLQFVAKADDIGSVAYNLIEPQESEPIAQGCIGYVNDGTDDSADDDDPLGSGSSTGLGGNGLNSGGNGLAGSNGDSVGSSSSSAAAATPKVFFQIPASSSSAPSSTTVPLSSSSSAPSISSSSTSSSSVSTTSSVHSTSSLTSSTVSSSSSSTTPNKLAVATTSSSSSSKVATSTSASSSSTSTSKVGTTTAASSHTTSSSLSSRTTASASSSSTPKVQTSTTSSSTTLKTSTSQTKTSTTSACSTSATPVSSLISSTTLKPTKTSTSTASPTSTAITCGKAVSSAAVASSYFIGKAMTVNTVNLCAASCLQNAQCLSFSYSAQQSCQLYDKMVGSTVITTQQGAPSATFYDRQCYALSKC